MLRRRGSDQKLTVKIEPPDAGSLVSVTVARGAGIANGEADGAQTPRVDRAAAAGSVSNGRLAIEQEAITVALTPKLDVVVAASVGENSLHVITTAIATKEVRMGNPDKPRHDPTSLGIKE